MTTAAEDVTNVLSRTTCGAHATHATSVFPCWSCDAARLIERLAAENSRLTADCDEIDQLRVRLEEAIEAHRSWKDASAAHWQRAVAAESQLAARDAELAKLRARADDRAELMIMLARRNAEMDDRLFESALSQHAAASESDEPRDHFPEDLVPIFSGMQPMWLAALVLGFNEMAKNGTTLGDKVYFRLFRERLHEALKAHPKPEGWQITFAKPADASDLGLKPHGKDPLTGGVLRDALGVPKPSEPRSAAAGCTKTSWDAWSCCADPRCPVHGRPAEEPQCTCGPLRKDARIQALELEVHCLRSLFDREGKSGVGRPDFAAIDAMHGPDCQESRQIGIMLEGRSVMTDGRRTFLHDPVGPCPDCGGSRQRITTYAGGVPSIVTRCPACAERT